MAFRLGAPLAPEDAMGTLAPAPDRPVPRRSFLVAGTAGAVGMMVASGVAAAAPGPSEDPPNTHNMLVFGARTIFLSHLPMFDGLNREKTAFTSPHRYQVILQASFTKEGEDRSDVYVKDREANLATRIYTLNADPFVRSRLFIPVPAPALTSFTATVCRAHP